jgi:hypothetical protein
MANFAELRLFGKALRNTNPSNAVDSVLIRTCASKGYVMHPDCDPERVKSFMQSLPNNINTTFYTSFNDVLSINPYDLWMDQCMHYASTYGTGHTGTPYVPNDNPAEINFTECKIIEPITLAEVTHKIQDMLNSGIALKNDTLNDIFELIDEFQIELDLSDVKNREFLIRYHISLGKPFDTPEETLQAINFIITDNVCIVKDPATRQAYNSFGSVLNPGNDFEYVKKSFNSHPLWDWARIFNRYKPLFLGLRNSELRPVINKISKLSKTFHIPTVMPMSTEFLTPKYINSPSEFAKVNRWLIQHSKDMTVFELVKYYNAVCKRLQGKFVDTINIRNGKSWVKKTSWDLTQTSIRNLESISYILKRQIRKKVEYKLNWKNVITPSDLKIALPTSEKNFIGTLPIGSYIDVKPEDNLIVGIYWKGADGAQDLDLSFTDIDGDTVSWCNSYANENKGIVYSGDMTSADPEAAEYLLFRNNMPNGVFMCNSYCAEPESKYTFIVARLPEGEDFGYNHIVNPDDIIFQTPLVMTGNQMSMAIYVDGRFIFTDRITGNDRVAQAGVTTRDLIQSQIDMSNMVLTLDGYMENVSSDGEDVKLTDDKSALISLLA